MTLTAEVEDLGLCFYGSNPLFTITFVQGITALAPNGVPTDPATARLTMTPWGGVSADYSSTFTHVSAGTYTFRVNANVTGVWTGRAYAPPGSGQASVDFQFEVAATANP